MLGSTNDESAGQRCSWSSKANERQLASRGIMLPCIAMLCSLQCARHALQDLMEAHDVQLAVNLALRQEVLIEKCMGRRICRKCGKGWNLADIFLPAEGDRPQIIMPPLDPPVDCLAYMEQREDDKEDVRAHLKFMLLAANCNSRSLHHL